VNFLLAIKTILKLSKGQSEFVYRRRTDNTMVKRKSTKGQIILCFFFSSFKYLQI